MHHRDATGARIAKGDGHIDVLHADPSSLDDLADTGVNIALYMAAKELRWLSKGNTLTTFARLTLVFRSAIPPMLGSGQPPALLPTCN